MTKGPEYMSCTNTINCQVYVIGTDRCACPNQTCNMRSYELSTGSRGIAIVAVYRDLAAGGFSYTCATYRESYSNPKIFGVHYYSTDIWKHFCFVSPVYPTLGIPLRYPCSMSIVVTSGVQAFVELTSSYSDPEPSRLSSPSLISTS